MNYDTQEHEYMELKSQFAEERKFDQFIDEVDERVLARYGLSIADFADFDFWEYFDESVEKDSTAWHRMVDSAFEDYRFELESEHKDFF